MYRFSNHAEVIRGGLEGDRWGWSLDYQFKALRQYKTYQSMPKYIPLHIPYVDLKLQGFSQK